jgi:hypothetical protein
MMPQMLLRSSDETDVPTAFSEEYETNWLRVTLVGSRFIWHLLGELSSVNDHEDEKPVPPEFNVTCDNVL